MAEIKTGIFAKNVQKRLNRAQEKVLQKLGKADETKDEQFEQVVVNFRRQESEGSRLQREMKNYMAAIKGMQQASINLTQSLHEVYEPDWHGKEDVVLIGKDCDALWEDFHNKIVDSTLLNLDAYLQQFPDLKARVAKRSRKLIDYDSARHHLETLQVPGMKSDRKVIKAEEELKKAQRVFDDLNVGLQEELPTLWDSRVQFYIDTFKSVTSLETKFHREISLVCRQLYEVMTKLAEQHSDKMFTIQGAPSDSGPLRLARTPSPPDDESPPESPESNHRLRPVSPGPPRPKSPVQVKKGPPVPPPPKVSPPKEEPIIDLFGGEFLPAPSPSQPNERPGESLLDLDFDAFQVDESVAPIPQTTVPWDMWAGDSQPDQQEPVFVCHWADFGSGPGPDQGPDSAGLGSQGPDSAGLGVQGESMRRESTPELIFTNEFGEEVQQVQVLRPLSPDGSGSEYETAEEGPGWTSADDELQDRTGPGPEVRNQTGPQLRDQAELEPGNSKTGLGSGTLETEEVPQDQSELDPGPGSQTQSEAGPEVDIVLGLDLKVQGSAGPGPDGLDPGFDSDLCESSFGSAPGFETDTFAETKTGTDLEALHFIVQGSAGLGPDGPDVDLQIPDPGFEVGLESDPFESGFGSVPGFDMDPFAESKAVFGPDLFGFSTTAGYESDPFAGESGLAGLSSGPGESGLGLGSLPESGLHSDEDEAANQRLGTLYQELDQDQGSNAFNGFSQDAAAPSFFADFDKMNQVNTEPEPDKTSFPTTEGVEPKPEEEELKAEGAEPTVKEEEHRPEGEEPKEERVEPKSEEAPILEKEGPKAEGEGPKPDEEEPKSEEEVPKLEEEESKVESEETSPKEEKPISTEQSVTAVPEAEPEKPEQDQAPAALQKDSPLEETSEMMSIPSVVIEPASSNEGDDDRDADIISPTVSAGNSGTATASGVQHITPSDGTLPHDFLYKVETLHDFEAANSDELDLKRGDVVLVVPTVNLEDQEAGWLTGIKLSDWSSLGVSAQRGLFPENFIQRLD